MLARANTLVLVATLAASTTIAASVAAEELTLASNLQEENDSNYLPRVAPACEHRENPCPTANITREGITVRDIRGAESLANFISRHGYDPEKVNDSTLLPLGEIVLGA